MAAGGQIEELVDAARSTPPEFAADALIRLAESRLVEGRARKRELLEEAFRLASAAQEPFKMRFSGERHFDSRAGFRGRAYALDLDALSLQCRAVSAMLRIQETRRARQLFESTVLPPAPDLRAPEQMAYDFALFEQTREALASRGFRPQLVPALPPQDGGNVPQGQAPVRYWQSPDAAALLARLQALQPPRESSAEWRAAFEAFLDATAEWSETKAEEPAGVFHQKCLLLGNALPTVSPGPQRFRVLQVYLDVLVQSPLQQESRIEWFLPVRELLARADGDLLDRLRHARHPVIALYAGLERALAPARIPPAAFR